MPGLGLRRGSSHPQLLLLLLASFLLFSTQIDRIHGFLLPSLPPSITSRASTAASAPTQTHISRRWRAHTRAHTHIESTKIAEVEGDRGEQSSSLPLSSSAPNTQKTHTHTRTQFLKKGLLLFLGGSTASSVLNDKQGEVLALEAQSYIEQLREAIPVKTIRGTWRIREYRNDMGNELCKGRLKMKGFVEEPNKGTLEYTGCNEGKGRGNWLLKPARIAGGQIRFSARWKVKFSDGDALIYRGDVLAGGSYARATASIVDGEILRPFTGVTGNLSERKVGTFEADLIEPSLDEEKL